MKAKCFSVRPADWGADAPLLRAVREAVFMIEQRVPADLEWDGLDPDCAHALALSARGEAIGTARLTPDGHIGRMAVLAAWRGQGVGQALLEAMLTEARARGYAQVALNAQIHAEGFYQRFGFARQGDEFPDAGIPHVRMTLGL
ncbi:MAG TPA: GNAT family N-acetyltransferase [Burkholderiales bacterium]|nr:GNAT family N-acetyltransferase [Burkholderiales bacterium]